MAPYPRKLYFCRDLDFSMTMRASVLNTHDTRPKLSKFAHTMGATLPVIG